jgi:RNA recognition motif-containing protein
MNIYVGNLSPAVTEEDLMQAFGGFGRVESAKIIKDKFSGESRGFAFVEMPSDKEARAALNELNGKDLKGKGITVNQARPRAVDSRSRGRRGSSGRGGRGGGRGRY